MLKKGTIVLLIVWLILVLVILPITLVIDYSWAKDLCASRGLEMYDYDSYAQKRTTICTTFDGQELFFVSYRNTERNQNRNGK